MAACAGTSEEETSYHVDQAVTALDVGAVTVEPAGA
jgi:hypothetical protein